MAPGVAEALRRPETVEEIVALVASYPEAVETLDQAPRAAHVSAAARELRKAVEVALRYLREATLARPSNVEDDVIAVVQTLEALMLAPPDGRALSAVAKLIDRLERIDSTTHSALAYRLKQWETLELHRLFDALADVEEDPMRYVRTALDFDRGRPTMHARDLLCRRLSDLFDRWAGGRRPRPRGRERFVRDILDAASIPLPKELPPRS
jgi:hypothetical protein